MIFWMLIAVILLILVVIVVMLGNTSAENALALKASAFQESIQRKHPDSVLASIGSSEFLLLYKKAEASRRLPEKLGVMFGILAFTVIALSVFPINAHDDSLGAIARPALMIVGIIPGLIVGNLIAKSRGDEWMLEKMKELIT